MSFIRVIKTELYKNFHRKSSLILCIPMLLTVVIAFGFSKGVVNLSLTTGDMAGYSCMDFLFVIWNVLSGLGIIGLLLILFSSFQFSGEIEHGQIKVMLLRIGKRKNVVTGKYLASVIAGGISIIGTLLVCVLSYYVLIARTDMGTGSFGATIEGLSTAEIFETIGLQCLMYLLFSAISFVIGIYANPFITFILTVIVMYGANDLSGTNNFIAKLFPNYWGNQLITNRTASVEGAIGSICLYFALVFCIIAIVVFAFKKETSVVMKKCLERPCSQNP